jgi:hypothetical protein
MEPQAFLGVVTAPVPPPLSAQLGLAEGFGLLVQEVLPDTPASTAGIQKHDVVKLLNDQQLVDPNQLATLVKAAGKDKEVTLTLIRKGAEQKVTVKVGERVLPFRKRLDISYGYAPVPPPPEIFDGTRKEFFDSTRKVEDQARQLEDKAREYQGRVMKGERDRMKRPGPERAPGGVPSEDVLREARPGGGAQIKMYNGNSVTTLDGAKARLLMKDNDGEIEVSVDNGKRMLTAKDPTGAVVFNGPVNTDEERDAVPKVFRKKLDEIQVRHQLDAQGAGQSVQIFSSDAEAESSSESEVQ